MLSFGIEASRAFWTAVASVALASGSPPPSRAATVIARASLVNCWPRRESTIAFLCLIEAHLECPDTALSLGGRPGSRARRDQRSRELAVPGDRAPDALLEVHRRLPAGQLPQLGGIHELPVDLPRRRAVPPIVRLHVRAGDPAD